MPRGALSQADQALIGQLGSEGLKVSAYQLERWRLAGLLPKPERRSLGRGAGSTSVYPQTALPLARALAGLAGQGRSLHMAALSLFVAGGPVEEAALRKAMLWMLNRRDQLLQAAARRRGDADDIGDLAASKVSIYDPEVVASYFPDALGDKPISRAAAERRAQRRRELRDAAFVAAVSAVDPTEVPDDRQFDFMEAMGWQETAQSLREAMFDAVRAGRPFGTQDPDFGPFPTLADTARTAPLDLFYKARDIAHTCAAVNFLLTVSAAVDLASWELFSSTRTQPRWLLARMCQIAHLARPAAMILSVLSMVSCEQMSTGLDDGLTLDAARQYGFGLMPDALRAYARATRKVGSVLGTASAESDAELAQLDELADDLELVPADHEVHQFLLALAVGAAMATAAQMMDAFQPGSVSSTDGPGPAARASRPASFAPSDSYSDGVGVGELQEKWGLSSSEADALAGYTGDDADALDAASELLERHVKPERVPFVVWGEASRMGGRSLLEVALTDGPVAALAEVHKMFDFEDVTA